MLTEIDYAREIPEPLTFGPGNSEPKLRKFKIDRINHLMVDLTKVILAKTFIALLMNDTGSDEPSIETVDYDKCIMIELVFDGNVSVYTPYTMEIHEKLCPPKLIKTSKNVLDEACGGKCKTGKECCCGK